MPKRTIDTALEVMAHLKSEGCGDVVAKDVVLRAVSLLASDDPRGRERYLSFLELHGILKPTGEKGSTGCPVYAIDWLKVEKLEGV